MSSGRPRPLPSEPGIDHVSPPTSDHALGLTDIYGSLTPRQISMISMPRTVSIVITLTRVQRSGQRLEQA